jgi:hypothetical protein
VACAVRGTIAAQCRTVARRQHTGDEMSASMLTKPSAQMPDGIWRSTPDCFAVVTFGW